MVRAVAALIHRGYILPEGGEWGCVGIFADFSTNQNLLVPSRALPGALVFERVLFAPGG